MNHPYILTLDIGSSSVRAMVYDSTARIVLGESPQIKYAYAFRATSDGGSELDANALLDHCFAAMDAALERFDHPIAAVASDCFTLSILGVDVDGNAVTPIYTYADSRRAREVEELRTRFDERVTHQRVGTMFHTSYLPARLLWLARERADEFALSRRWMSFGEYLYFKLLGVRVVSHSIASWTGLLNRATLDWDEDLLKELPIGREQLSVVGEQLSGKGLRDEYAQRWRALKDAVWIPTIGDGAAANLGSGCVDASRVAVTVGTSSAMRVAKPEWDQVKAGEREKAFPPVPPLSHPRADLPWGLWSYRITKDLELLGGALNEGGNIFSWMTKVLKLDSEREVENELARLEPDAHGLTILPFLAGERAPNWNADARGAILGLTLSTRPTEILLASMEAVAYRLGLVYEMLRGVASSATEVIASGGALEKSPTWVQMIADVLNARVIASAESEATSRGCALIALKALGLIESFGDVPARLGRVYAPDSSRHGIYARAMERQKKWYNLIVKEQG